MTEINLTLKRFYNELNLSILLSALFFNQFALICNSLCNYQFIYTNYDTLRLCTQSSTSNISCTQTNQYRPHIRCMRFCIINIMNQKLFHCPVATDGLFALQSRVGTETLTSVNDALPLKHITLLHYYPLLCPLTHCFDSFCFTDFLLNLTTPYSFLKSEFLLSFMTFLPPSFDPSLDPLTHTALLLSTHRLQDPGSTCLW